MKTPFCPFGVGDAYVALFAAKGYRLPNHPPIILMDGSGSFVHAAGTACILVLRSHRLRRTDCMTLNSSNRMGLPVDQT